MSCVLITDRFTPESIEHLRQNFNGEIIKTEHYPQKNELNKATAMLIRSRTKIDKELLAQAPNLKVVITATSGFDHIDLELAKNKNIKIMYTPSANAVSAAELTLLHMLSALRKMTETQRVLRDGRWKDDISTGFELKNKSVGIIGLGRVGSHVAHLLQSFGALVYAYDPYQKDEVFQKLNLQRFGLSEVFAHADILTLHVPLTAETRRMVRAETLELMQDGVIIINTSRGKVIDESALVSALESGHVSQAALDVFEHEPLARDSRLRKLSNVMLTPHIGAYTEEAFHKASQIAVQKLLDFFKNGDLSDTI